MVGGAPKVAQPIDFEIKGGEPHIVTGIQGLSFRIRLKTTAFDHRDPLWRADKLTGYSDPRRTGTDDSHVCIDGAVVRQTFAIDKHL